MIAPGPSLSSDHFASHGHWSLWDMLQNYFPIYQILLDLGRLQSKAEIMSGHSAFPSDVQDYVDLVQKIESACSDCGLVHTSDLARRSLIRLPSPKGYVHISLELTHLKESLETELEKESAVRIPPDRKDFYERDELFGPKVAAAFPSCERDVRKAGSCYSLGQEDACVHHLMLVLERGLNALATKLGVPYHRTNWQNIIEQNAKELKSRGAEFAFHRDANAQFGFLKDAYRNHSEHARDDHYDIPKALSILNHVRDFMQALEKGGLGDA
jgi:hypothetical protein